jgi:multiple sugar transport system permease protein
MMTRNPKKWIVFTLLLIWFFFSMFPVYWTLITSVKTPPAVNLGPTYLPFVDFQPTLEYYTQAFAGVRGDFFTNFINSTIISLSATLVSVLLGSMVAYALVRFIFRIKLLSGLLFVLAGVGSYVFLVAVVGLGEVYSMGIAFLLSLIVGIGSNLLNLPGPVLGNKDVVFWFVSQRMMPPIVSAFALYLLYSKIGKVGFKMLDTYFGVTLCYIAFSLPIVVWLMRDFFSSLPAELEEAALIDNVPRIRIFFEIVIPISLPGLIAVSLITFSFIWNEFLIGFILTTGRWQTLPVLLAAQNSMRGNEWWSICVATVIAVGPMAIITIFLSRMMRSGMLLGSIK